MGPVGPALSDHADAIAEYLATRGRFARWRDRFFCNVIGGHQWMRLDDHPMHHVCPLCKRECIDWVW
jgi:hypothetical protein